MKNKNLAILLLASTALLGSCGGTSNSTSTDSSSSGGVSSSVSASSSGDESTGSSSSSIDYAAEYGAFSITPATGVAEAVYDSSANTYTIHVAPSKAKYTLVGYFKGKIIIDNANALTAYKGCQLTFNQAYLVAPEGDAISYGNDDGNVEIVAKKDTVNYIVAEDGNAVTSSHNVEFDGKGTLNIIASNHGVKGDDIKVYEAPIINVSGCGKDPFHGHNFLTDNDGADSYAGTLTISGGEQAFEMQNGSGTESDPYSDGAITINAGAVIKVDSVKNVFFAYSTVSISGAVTATNVSYGAVVPVVAGLLSLTVTEPGFFTSNGSAISSGTY